MTPDTLTLAPETAAPAITTPAASIVPMASPDRATLAVETQRQPGGTLDPDSWIVPTGERLTTFLKNEPDQARIDRAAWEWLQTGADAQAKGQGGGIAEDFKNGLRTYRDFRKSRGEEPFQFLPAARTRAEEKAAREQVPFFQKLFTAPERMAEAFPEDQRQAFEDRFTGALDPIAEKHKTAGVMLVSTMLNRPAEEVADLWPAFRAKYAADHLGISGPVDDAAFYQAAGKAFEQETKDDETARTIAQQAQAAAIQGRPLSYAIEQGKAATGEAWKKFAPAARAGYASILSEFSDSEIKHGRALFEAVADMEGKPVEDIAKGDGTRAAWVVALEAYGNADQAGRDRIMNLIGLQAQSEGQDLTNYFKRLGAAFGSGVDMLTQGVGTLSARGQVAEFDRIAAAETDPKLKAEVLARIPYLKGKASFAQDIATAGIRVSRYIDQKREVFFDAAGDFTVMAAESIPTMAAAALPMGAGLPIVAASYAERDLATLRREAPNTDEATLAATAYASGALEAGIDRLQFMTLGARLPKLNAKLMQFGKPGAVAVAAARVATVTAAETVQEVGQDLTRPAVQEIAAALSQDIPGPNWGKVLSDEADALGDIAGVSLIFGIIGGTGSTVMDYMQAPKIAEALKDRDGLALAGFSPETVENVATLAEENPAAAAETLKAAMMETPKEERQANAQAARARIEEDTAPTAEEAGIPTMTKEPDGRIAVNFPDAPAILADSPESALDAVREWEQGQEVDTTKAVREYLDFLTDYHASNPEATFTGKQTTSAPTLETWAGSNKERIAQANARVDILMRQAGTEMGIERPLLSEVPILGTSRNVRAGALTRMVAEIHKGGNPLTVIEEAAEAVGKWIMADSKVSESKLLGWIRTTEKQTGTKILSDELATMTPEARAQELAEGFSQIAKANAVGRIQDSALPSAVKSFFRAFKEAIASALRIAADFARLRTEGKVDPEFSYWLDVAAGLEPEFQMENLTRQMEAEMQAEAMAGFTEIQDALKGKIPHPDTLQAAGDPLAGDVRRLHDGMMNNPENGANKAARTRKTNEFFLPKGTAGNLDELRRSMNEQGFDFQTPAEMIEAADLSISYGRKQFGTADATQADMNPEDWQPTFSIAFRTDPLLAAIEARIKSPEKKAEVYQKMKARVSAVKRRFEDRRLRGEFDTEAGAIDKARFEEIRDLATLEAIAKSLPPELRGKIVGSFRKVADLKTTKGRQTYMEKLLPRIERALESSLRRQYRAAIRRQIQQAAFNVAESRTRGGKIGAIGHAVFEEVKRAIKLTDDPETLIDGKTAAEKAEEIAAKLRETLEGSPDLTDAQIEELDERIAAVELFGAYGDADSARLAEALAFLNGTYKEGRKEWLATLAARRDVRFARVSTVETAMGREEGKPVTDAERTTAKRRGESLLRKFDEAVMQAALSGSQKIRRLAELSRSPAIMALTDEMEMAFLEAENQEADANAADNQALAAAMRRIFGTSTEYGTAKKLRELTTATGPAPVEKIEGRKKETVSVPLKYVENILAGELDAIEAGGERFAEDVKAFDAYDLTQLEMAWEAFNELPEDEQAQKRTLSFERTVAAGDRVTIGPVNQLEGLQLYLTMKQPDQFEKLDRLGYDEETLAQLEEWLRPEVKALGAWMVDHIGAEAFTLDSIHRAEKGVGLKLVENYFPVRNDVSAADNTGLSIDGNATRHTGRSIGAIKERVANSAPPAYVNALAVFLANRAQVNFWKSHVGTLREWGGVIRDERFAAAVKIGIGETYYQSLETMLRRIESGGALNAAKLMDWERMVKNLTSSFAVGTLGGRASTLAVNVAAGLNAGLEIPAADLAAGIAEVFARPEAFKDAFNSPAIQRRLAEGSSYEAQLAKSSGPSRNPTISQLNAWAAKGVEPINLMDTGANVIGAAVVWEHTRKESLRAGMTEDEARTEADRKVSRLLLRAAQPTTRLAKSELELKAAENPLAALFTLFTSEPRKTLAILYMAAREVTTGKGTYGKPMAAQQLFVAAVIVQTADFLIRSAYAALAKAKDDDPEDALDRLRARIFDAKAWGYALTTTHLRSVPIAGEVWSQAWAKALDQKAFTGSQNPLNRATREILTFEKPETIGEAVDGGIGILQGVGPVIPGGALFAQGGNVAEFMAGVSQSNGLDFSDEDRAQRIKARFNAYKATLETIHGKTQQPTGKTGKDGKPATRTDQKIQAAKWAAMTDRLRADLAPASPEIRALVLESITAPEEVKKRITKELNQTPPPAKP